MQTEDTLVMQPGTATPKTLGRYELLREIGRGGMSTVYAARDGQTGQTVALKILALPPALASEQQREMIARFDREAKAVARISHPNVLSIYDVGEQDGSYFLSMELLEGQTLRERLAHGALTPAQTSPILCQIADALEAVHREGIVHRDVKPSNVMLLPDGVAKLLDFGVARQSDDATITSTGAIVGSPAYMAPEQVRGEPGTAASDVWALGVLLYEMLAGHPPFNGKSIPTVLYQVTHETPAPIVGLPTPIQKVLRRALDKNPSRRYAPARALTDSLRASLPHLVAEPIMRSASPSPRWVRTGWILLPILAAAGLVAWIRPHPHPPIVSKPIAAPPLLNLRAMSSLRPTRLTQRHPGMQGLAAPKAHPVKHRAIHAISTRKRPQAVKMHWKATPRHRRRARRYAVVFRRIPRVPARNNFDAQTSEHLQKFIWGEGR